MTVLNILTTAQRAQFDVPPKIPDKSKKDIFSLPRVLNDKLHAINTENNQIHFVLMAGYYKLAKRFYNPAKYHKGDIESVILLLNVHCNFSKEISKATAYEYRQLIRQYYNTQIITKSFENILQTEAIEGAQKLLKPSEVFETLVERILKNQFEVPTYTEIAKIITKAFKTHHDYYLDIIKQLQGSTALENLSSLLMPDGLMSGRYYLSRYKRINHSLSPRKISSSVADFNHLKFHFNALSNVYDELSLSQNTIKHHAQWVEKSDMHQILRKAKHKQQFDLVCFVAHQVYQRSDHLIDILVQSVQSIKASTLREHQASYYELKHQRTQALSQLSELVTGTIAPNIKKMQDIFESDGKQNEKLELLEATLNTITNSTSYQSVALLDDDTVYSDDTSYYDLLEKNSRKLQNKVSDIIKSAMFDEENSNKPLIAAIKHYQNSSGSISSNAPQSFLSDEQKLRLVAFDENGVEKFRAPLYKVLLFIEIADAIKSGTLNLKHSYRYKAFEHYLIDKDLFKKSGLHLIKKHEMQSFENHVMTLASLKENVERDYRVVNKRITTNLNFHFNLRDDQSFNVATPKVIKDESIDPLVSWLPLDKFIPIISVLDQINSYTNFQSSFKHHSTTRHKSTLKESALLAALVGYGCNINIGKMAKISKGINEHDIDYVRTWFLSNENLIDANNKILAFTEKLEITKLFKKDKGVNHTASDGQKYNISVDSLNAGYSFKYFGLGRGVSRYMFIDESHRLFYSTVINANEREAAYVIDGLMHNEIIKSDIHSTDTFGFSEVVFALTHLLGFAFAPRIKNFKDQQLYAFNPRKEYREKGYALLPVKQINTEIIEEQWDNILRFVLTIKERHTTASQLLKRLTSYSKQHRLYQALREFGRIIKTKFLLNYIDDLELRQEIEKQLNKIESANRFSKAIFFGNNGEYLYATKDEQDVASNALRLIQNAIICWNYLYFTDKLNRETSKEKKENLIKSLENSSIVHWQHINFYGEYDFTNLEKAKKSVKFKF